MLLLVSGFLLGFAAAAGLLSRWVKPPRVSGVHVKLDWLAARPTQYDALIVGSSRMRQLVPSILDSELAAKGLAVASFNLAVDGMRPPEDAYVLEQALAHRQAPLKFIFIEANPMYLKIDEEEYDTDRLVYWHDNARMAALWHRAFSHLIARPPWFGKWVSDTWRQVRFATEHTRYWAWNSARYGQGSQAFHDWLGLGQHPKLERGLGQLNDGYIPNDSEPMSPLELKSYNQGLAKILKLGRKLDPMDAASQAHFSRAAALARKHGARLVVIAPPHHHGGSDRAPAVSGSGLHLPRFFKSCGIPGTFRPVPAPQWWACE